VEPACQVDQDVPLLDLLLAMPTGDLWEDAGLVECLTYVLKSKYLVIPPHFHGKYRELFKEYTG